MRIGVNVRLLIKDRIDGIARFTYESLKRITVAHPEHEFVFFFDRSYDSSFLFNGNIKPVIVYPQTRRPFLNNIWTDYTLPMALKRHPVDLFLSMDGMLPLSTEIPCLPVIHDLNFEHHPEWLPKSAYRYYASRYPKFAAKGKRIATVSEYSKADIASTYRINANLIDVVYNGVSEKFQPAVEAEKQAIKDTYAGSMDYFLFVGSVHPRKNLVNTLLAFDAYCTKSIHKRALIIAGEKYFGNSELEKILHNMANKERVYFTGKVDDATLIQLYSGAHTFVYASLFEGFGIPVLEAMQSKVPVIASNSTSLPEICGEAAILVDPQSVDQICNAMCDTDQVEIREKLINLGLERAAYFTWDRTAALLWNSIEKTLTK